jgi:hypothetical protein
MSIAEYKYTLSSDNPDYVYEKFWFRFKVSIYNALSKIDHGISDEMNNDSLILNNIRDDKSDRWISKIISFIEKNIIKYTNLFLIRDINTYHTNILVSNLHRWIIIADTMKIRPNNNIIMLYEILKCKTPLKDEIKKQICSLDDTDIIKVLIKEKECARLDRLLKYPYFHDIFVMILKDNYETIVPPQIKKCSKVIKKLIL